jgi:hypothetical protein
MVHQRTVVLERVSSFLALLGPVDKKVFRNLLHCPLAALAGSRLH